MTTRIAAALIGSLLLAPPIVVAQPEKVEPEPTPETCPHACCFEAHGGIEVCDIFDFIFFQEAWVAGEPCAVDMDTSTGVGVGDIFDFLAFQQEFLDGLMFGFPC